PPPQPCTLSLHDALPILDAPERQRYSQEWSDVQARFLDDPRAAARQADQLIANVLGEIGYPAQDRDRQLALASVDHPHGLSEYRDRKSTRLNSSHRTISY